MQEEGVLVATVLPSQILTKFCEHQGCAGNATDRAGFPFWNVTQIEFSCETSQIGMIRLPHKNDNLLENIFYELFCAFLDTECSSPTRWFPVSSPALYLHDDVRFAYRPDSPRGFTFTWWGCCGLCFWHKPAELAHSLLLCSCVCLCLYRPFNCISFHKFSRQLSALSLCSSGFISALLVLSTIYIYLHESLLQPWYRPLWLTGLKAPTV